MALNVWTLQLSLVSVLFTLWTSAFPGLAMKKSVPVRRRPGPMQQCAPLALGFLIMSMPLPALAERLNSWSMRWTCVPLARTTPPLGLPGLLKGVTLPCAVYSESLRLLLLCWVFPAFSEWV